MILLVDNYDSFTYNLAHLFGELGAEVLVRRNDELTADEAEKLSPSHLVISPGPGRPEDAGEMPAILRRLAGRVPTLGVCLGHQAIVQVFGGEVGQARELVHGKATAVEHDGRGIFRGLPEGFQAGRYHSLAATSVPDVFEISATAADGEVMAVRHRELPLDGVQFHPESVLTPRGLDLVEELPRMIQDALAKLLDGSDLSREETRRVMDSIMAGGATPAQIGGFLVALRLKGETADEIAGAAEAMRDHVVAVHPKRDDLVDTAGTGGDGGRTFNISTAAALVAAAAGAGVAKHGNRAVSSLSGSADVLEQLGFELDLPPARIADSIDELGFGFMFAPAHHPAMKHAGPVRTELAARTVFNVLGPLTNPAGARAQVVGVYSAALVPVIADVLARLGARRAFVVHGAGGIDELSPAGPNLVCEVVDGDGARSARSTRSTSASRAATRTSCAAARRRRTRRASARSSRARTAGAARRSCSTPPARSPRRATPPTCAKGSRSRARRSTRALPASGSSGWRRSPGRLPRDEIPGRTRRARASAPSRSSSAARRRRATCVRTATSPTSREATRRPARARCRCSSTSASRGSLDDLRAARAATVAAAARQGLLLDATSDLAAARDAGADAALLILRDLDDAAAAALLRAARALGLDTLVEAHDARRARAGDRARRARDRDQRARPRRPSGSTGAASSQLLARRTARPDPGRRERDRIARAGRGGRAGRRERGPRSARR